MKTTYTVGYRRKREGRTNYKKRLELLKGRKPRLVIRRTNTQLILQIIEYNPDGDKIIITTNSNELKNQGWTHSFKNMPAAYLAGLLTAKKAKEKNVTEAILDLGLQKPHKGSRIYSALHGVIDGGLNVPANEEIFAEEKREQGEHIAKYIEKHKTITQDFQKVAEKLKGKN